MKLEGPLAGSRGEHCNGGWLFAGPGQNQKHMVSQVNKAYASDDYDTMDKLLDSTAEIVMKYQ